MSFLVLAIVAALSGQEPAQTGTPAVVPAPGAASPVAELTPAQQQAQERARAQLICSRRAPTGRRLEQTTCISREMAAARARAGREEHENATVQTGWNIERGD